MKEAGPWRRVLGGYTLTPTFLLSLLPFYHNASCSNMCCSNTMLSVRGHGAKQPWTEPSDTGTPNKLFLLRCSLWHSSHSSTKNSGFTVVLVWYPRHLETPLQVCIYVLWHSQLKKERNPPIVWRSNPGIVFCIPSLDSASSCEGAILLSNTLLI